MITPRFTLSQDAEFLIIKIRAPHCSLRELETYIEGNDFRFICSPYFLRLNLPGCILENDSSTGKFDSEKGEFEFRYAKVNKNEHFEGLDFITTLLAPKKQKKEPKIEVLSSEDHVEGDEWYLEQNPASKNENVLSGFSYGFANQKTEILRNTEAEFWSVFDIKNVDTTNLSDRMAQKHDTESMNFSQEHYLMDFFENEEIKMKIEEKNPWGSHLGIFSPQEIDILKDFPNKEYLLDKEERRIVFLGLVDILYAYCYDQRTTEFEGNCESGWTITKISSTLSWFNVFEDEKQVLKSNFRRSCIYPLYRNFELCQKVFEDLKLLLSLGEVFIVKCLIEIYNFFHSSAEPRYILNDLYIKDYIIYMQKCDQEMLKEVIKYVNETKIEERDMDLNYEEIQKIKTAFLNEENPQNALISQMNKLQLANRSDDSDDCGSTSSEDEDSNSSSSSDSNDD